MRERERERKRAGDTKAERGELQAFGKGEGDRLGGQTTGYLVKRRADISLHTD